MIRTCPSVFECASFYSLLPRGFVERVMFVTFDLVLYRVSCILPLYSARHHVLVVDVYTFLSCHSLAKLYVGST